MENDDEKIKHFIKFNNLNTNILHYIVEINIIYGKNENDDENF